ncbi:MAG: hypothetical protein JWQ94_4358 [Tardiphaga sp.]|nr:hypothetical protein [Tardiphaga sp.]
MKSAHQFVLLVVLSVMVAAFVILPRSGEHAAVLIGEGRYGEAIAQLRQQLKDAPRDPELLAALARSYLAIGEDRQAIEAFDKYLVIRPADRAAMEKNAELLLRCGLIDRYLQMTTRAVAVRPTLDKVNRLVELLRLYGRTGEETAVLRTYAGNAMLDSAQLERLGGILAEQKNWKEARRALEIADRTAPPAASSGRFLLLEVLIQTDAVDAAAERAQAWMAAWKSPFLSGQLMIRMAQSGLAGPASDLALKFTDTMPDNTFEITNFLATKGERQLAYRMLVRWKDRVRKPTGNQLRGFVQASALVGDVSGPFAKFLQVARDNRDPNVAGEMLDEMATVFGYPALAGIRPQISASILLAQPLLAAEMALFEGNRELAAWYANRVDAASLPSGKRAGWLALLRRVDSDADLFLRLSALWREQKLPAEMVPDLANEAIKQGQIGTYRLILNRLVP